MKSKIGGRDQTVSLLREKVVASFSRIGFVVFLVGLSACTKSFPYQSVLKEQVVTKSDIDFSAEYLYVPSTGATSRTLAGPTIPFMLGEEKIVRLELTKEALRAYEVEMDPSYQRNPQNKGLVFEIPVSHVQYRCQQDRLGNCRNQEEENNSIPWDQKSQFKPDFSRVRITEANFLPESIDRLLGGPACMTEVSRKHLDYEIDKNHINFSIERAMVNNIRCANVFDYISDLSSSVISNYSLVKLNSVATRSYRIVNYPLVDESIFGFFKLERKLVDVDNSNRETQKIRYMNRWDPDRRELVYHLSDEFNKPENELLKKAAYLTIDRVNDGLAAAGVQFRLSLKEPTGKKPGDMRYNMIVLVEDPVGGVIGYGPSIAHPRTGEILAGRVIMFSGALKQSAYGMYEEIREQRKRGDLAARKVGAYNTKEGGNGDNRAAFAEKLGAGFGENSLTVEKQDKVNSSLEVVKRTEAEDRRAKFGHSSTNSESVERVLAKSLGNPDEETEGSDSVDMLMARRRSCFLRLAAAPAGNMNPKILKAINERFGPDELKEWEELSATEKQFVLDLVMPEAFAGTMIHELGHNLGLRHNFRGSQDKGNFYSGDELAKKGIDYQVNSSSVMEYYNTFGLYDLPVFGKYDIAALRFGYQRQVTKRDESYLQIEGTLEEKSAIVPSVLRDELLEKLDLRSFMYCSDEGAEASVGCKPFDSGTTYTEMVDSVIQRYKSYIDRASFRRKRVDFSVYGTEHAQIINELFYELRSFMEAAETLRYSLNVSYSDKVWNEEYADLKRAVLKAGEFLTDVLLIPERTCLILDTTGGGPRVRQKLLYKQDRRGEIINCSEVKWKGKEVLLEDVGRFFQDRKDGKTSNPYVDQIDVRGSWTDKVLAAKYLFARRLQEEKGDARSVFDKNTDNFTDFPELEVNLTSVLQRMMSDDMTVPYTVSFSGKTERLLVPLAMLDTHDIPQQYSKLLSSYLKIPVDRGSNFIEVLGRQIVRQAESSDGRNLLASQALEWASVYKTPNVSEPLAPEALSVVFDGIKYAASKGNTVAFDHLSTYTAYESAGEAIQYLLSAAAGGPIKKSAVEAILNPVTEVRRGLRTIDSLTHPFQVKMALLKNGLKIADASKKDDHYEAIVRGEIFKPILDSASGDDSDWTGTVKTKRDRDIRDKIASIRPRSQRILSWLPGLKKK